MIEVTSNRMPLLPYISELLEYNYIIYSIFEGTVPGKIFVDELPTPKVILVWDGTSDSGIYIEGQYTPQIGEELNHIILQEIFKAAETYEDCYDFTCCWAPHTEWEEHFDDIFHDILIQQEERSFYSFHRGQQMLKWRPRLPHHLTLLLYEKNSQTSGSSGGLKLSNLNLNQSVSDTNFDIQKFEGFAKLEKTLQNAKDPFVCVIADLKKQKLITRVFPDWTSDNHIEIGIFTDPEYRKQGLGSLTAAAMIESALKRGYDHVGWHCWIENEASAKTAVRAGFKFDRTHHVRHAWYNQFDNLLVHIDHLLENQRVKDAVMIFDDLMDQREKQTPAYEASYFRRQAYYAHWLLNLQIINYANGEKESLAIKALVNRIKWGIDDPQAFIDMLHSKILTRSVWQNTEWQNVIENLTK